MLKAYDACRKFPGFASFLWTSEVFTGDKWEALRENDDSLRVRLDNLIFNS
jgi:hypothetical protein